VRGKELDARSDLFSFGVVLYEMVTGTLPFRGDSTGVIFDGIMNRAPASVARLNPALPAEFERILDKSLEKDRALRYQSAAEMRADLKRLQRGTESGRVAAPAAEQARPASKRGIIAATAVPIILLAASAGIFWFKKNSSAPSAAVAAKPSVAVLPLQNLSAEPDSAYFSDGMTDEITTKLSKIQGIDVTSHSAVTALKTSDKSPAEIGKALGVRYLLEGSVRKAADQVRINVHLIDSTSGFQVWADDFTGETKDVFSLQEQTALKIAGSLNLKLTPQEQQAIEHRYTQNPQAYDAYLRGEDIIRYGGDQVERLEAARQQFEEALRFDPDYPRAIAGLGWVEAQIYRNLDANPSHLERAEQFAQRALSLAPQLAETHVAVGFVDADKYDYAGAAHEFQAAVDAEPDDSFAWDSLSWALAYEQPPQGAAAEKAARESLRLRPSQPQTYYHLGRALLVEHRYQEAIAAFEQVQELSPNNSYAPLGLGQAYLAQGEYDKAVAALSRGLRPASINHFWLAAAYAARGDQEKALATLQKAFDLGFKDFAALDSSPYFAKLRNDQRFQQLMQRYRK